MREAIRLPFVFFLVFLTGCAAQGAACRKSLEDANAKLASCSHKFGLARQENLNLKRELTLFRKSTNIDSRLFLRSLDIFNTVFRDEAASAELTDRGMVVIISSEHLFVSASDALSDEGEALLDKIASFIGARFGSHYVYVEGHTDNQSLAVFEWKSDWDFSFARALSIVRYLTQKNGMDPLRFSASGFGQYRPRASQETKEGRRLNRRIELIISPQRPQTLNR